MNTPCAHEGLAHKHGLHRLLLGDGKSAEKDAEKMQGNYLDTPTDNGG